MTVHNLDAVVERLVPPMLHMPLGGGDWQASAFHDGDPVVEIIGGRATGKSALLKVLRTGYRTLVPTAFVELAGSPYSADSPEDRERLDAVNASPVTNILFTLSHELANIPAKYKPRLRFSRLSPALMVIAAWRPDAQGGPQGQGQGQGPGPVVPPAELVEAESELRELLDQHPAPAAARDAAIHRWGKAVNGVVGGLLPQVPGLAGVLDAALETLLGRRGSTPLDWWRDRLGRDDPVKGLFGLVRQFRRRGAGRTEVESHLIGALLADIDDAYGTWARQTTHPPLILLDDVDDDLGKRFLAPFVEQYAQLKQRRRWVGRPLRPVVIATSRGRGTDAGHGSELTPATRTEPWTKPELRPPATWLLRLRIPSLTADEIRPMLDGHDYPAALPEIIARLSGGRTGNALLLAEASRQRLCAHGPFDCLDLLDLPLAAPDGLAGEAEEAGHERPVAELLLEQLLPDATVRNQLLDLAPALDEDAAASLAHRLPSRPDGWSAALHVRHLVDNALSRKLWNHHPWPTSDGATPLITDRGMRAVLLHVLREDGDGQRWSLGHRRLANHYNGRDLPADSVGHSPHHLHHALALGQLDTLVVRALHHHYLEAEPRAWLRTVNFLAAAPRPRGGFPPYQPHRAHSAAPGEPPPCPGCTDGDPRGVHSAIRQVLGVTWRLSDPSAERPSGYRDPALRRLETGLMTLNSDYEERSRRDARRSDVHNAYVDALATGGWIDALLAGTQAPELPVT
ncbi:hypothetical protein [Streptomyces sp. 7N604]|uniref:hypothetical protein n=1 Tax=Streptomyces sp. 7N604 TaxID=3457415 RepID=UPI003FD07D19